MAQELQFLGVECHLPYRLAFVELCVAALEQFQSRHRFLVLGSGRLLGAVHRTGDALQVGQDELHVQRLDVAGRVERAIRVSDVGVLETADDVHDRIHLADVGQEFIAHAHALGGPAGDAGDVHDAHLCRDDLLAFDVLIDDLQPIVGDGDKGHVGLDGGEFLLDSASAAGGDHRAEDCALAHQGQTDDSEFQGHGDTIAESAR